jgi:general secretion pathway protein J
MRSSTRELAVMVKRRRGFTLVELLIAISLLGLISVVVYSAIWTASRSLDAVEARVEINEEVRVTQQFFRQALSQSRGVMAVHDGRMQVVFTGEPHTIAFVAPAPLQRGVAGGLYRYRLELDGRKGEERSLRLFYWHYWAGKEFDAELEPQGEVILSEGIDNLTFSYFGSEEPDADGEWMDEWTRTDSLPLMVRIMLEKKGNDSALDMMVAIKGRVG